MKATTRHGRFSVAWGSWSGDAGGAARGKRRRRGETLRRLESLEDRRLLAASISFDPALALQYNGDTSLLETVTVTTLGAGTGSRRAARSSSRRLRRG